MEETKKCPFCAEMIKAEAIVCRYCHRDLPYMEDGLPKRTIIAGFGIVMAIALLGLFIAFSHNPLPGTTITNATTTQISPLQISPLPLPSGVFRKSNAGTMLGLVEDFMNSHPDVTEQYGTYTTTYDDSHWAEGTRIGVETIQGKRLLFYLKDGRVLAVYDQTSGKRSIVWGHPNA